WDHLDLLLEWGADPNRVCLTTLFGTYSADLFARFHDLGVDLTANHELGEALAYHPGNKPLFGFAKRHREQDPRFQKELNVALVHPASEGNEKGVQLSLWAGADPHAPAPSLRFPDLMDDEDMAATAIEEACREGHVRILDRLRPDPSRDDFDDLYRIAPNGAIVELLSRRALPKHVGGVIRMQVLWLQDHPLETQRSTDTLERLFEVGARWETSTPEEIAAVRSSLLKMRPYTFIEMMKLLAKGSHVDPAIPQALGRTPAIRARMAKVGFTWTLPSNHNPWDRPTRSREVLTKFGVAPPKTEKRLPRVAHIGSSRGATQHLHLDRKDFYERVWSEPVEKLAKSWGLSGRGLAKACERLQIPVPPRGSWAKARRGRSLRPPRLPEVQAGEAEEIVVHVRSEAD
ncbi:MAG: hypothetical protein ACRD1Z_07545, partial [Vicinamibacteria bacterium]